MLGFLFGTAKADNEIADIIHMLLSSFHRAHERHGDKFLLGTIKANTLLTSFTPNDRTYTTFKFGAELSDFEFLTDLDKPSSEPPFIQVMGYARFYGFHATVGLRDGKLMATSRSSPLAKSTRRANALADIFCNRFGAVRMF
jgi:hypothetical protein